MGALKAHASPQQNQPSPFWAQLTLLPSQLGVWRAGRAGNVLLNPAGLLAMEMLSALILGLAMMLCLWLLHLRIQILPFMSLLLLDKWFQEL